MGWSQYAGLYYGLPLCNNFVKTLSPEIRKHFMPFLNTNLGGILTLARPQFLMTCMVLDTDLVGPIFSNDWLCSYFYLDFARTRAHHPADIIRLLKYQQNCTSQRLIFDVDATDDDYSNYKRWVIQNQGLKNRPLADFVGYYLCGTYKKPTNIHEYDDYS
jgi:hypothetical protein